MERDLRLKLIFLCLLGALIRLLMMAFLIHGDCIYVNFSPHLLVYHNIWDIYEYSRLNFASDVLKTGQIYYSPLLYFTIGLSQFIFRPLMPTFDNWMDTIGNLRPKAITLGMQYSQHFLNNTYDIQVFRNVFFMKIPYFLFDCLALLILIKLVVGNAQNSLKITKLWVLNPVVLYSLYAIGNFDIFPVFFIAGCLYFVFRRRNKTAMVSLGLAIAYKIFPIALLLPCAALLGETIRERIKLFFIGLCPFLSLFLVFFISSKGFVTYSLMQGILVNRFGFKAIDPIALLKWVCVGLIYLAIIYRAFSLPRSMVNWIMVRRFFILCISLIYIMIPISFHWYMWLLPLILFEIIEDSRLLRLFWMQVIILGLIWLAYKPYSIDTLALLGGLFFASLPSPAVIIDKFFPYYYVASALRIMFIATTIWMSFLIVAKIKLSIKKT